MEPQRMAMARREPHPEPPAPCPPPTPPFPGARPARPFPAAAGGGAAAELRGHELIEVPVEHSLDVARLDARPVVLDHLVGLQHVRADLVPEGDVAPLATECGELLLPLLPGPLRKPRGQDLQRDRLVGQL